MQDATGKTLPAPFGERRRAGAHGTAGGAGFRPAGRHAVLQTADSDIGLVAVDTDDLTSDDIRPAHEICNEGRGRGLIETTLGTRTRKRVVSGMRRSVRVTTGGL